MRLHWFILLASVFSFFAQDIFVDEGYSWHDFARIPVMHEGRVKPLNTVAVNSLLVLHGKRSIQTDNGSISALPWLAESLYHFTASAKSVGTPSPKSYINPKPY